jgi:hypothetical protein
MIFTHVLKYNSISSFFSLSISVYLFVVLQEFVYLCSLSRQSGRERARAVLMFVTKFVRIGKLNIIADISVSVTTSYVVRAFEHPRA